MPKTCTGLCRLKLDAAVVVVTIIGLGLLGTQLGIDQDSSAFDCDGCVCFWLDRRCAPACLVW